MAADPRGFIPASDAANGFVTDITLHRECTEIESIILQQSNYGFLQATITTTPMTSNAFLAALVVTNVNTTNNTVTIPGLAAELTASMPSCSTNLLGTPVTFSSTNLLPSPLVTSTVYYLIPTTTTDVYGIATSKQNAFQCPPVSITLAVTPSVVTGTTSITGNITGAGSVLGNIGIPGTLVIDGTSITIPATDTLAQIVAAINAAAIPNVIASIVYTYSYSNNNNCGNNCNCNCNCSCNGYNGYYNNGRNNCNNCNCNNNSSINNNVISTASLGLVNSVGGATTIGAGSTSALLSALGLTAGTFGEAGVSGNLIIDGITVVVNSTDTPTNIVANINAASIPNITASLSANGSSIVISNLTGTAITIGGTSSVLTALGFTAGTQQSSVVSATPTLQSELFYNAWKNIYFFPEQQLYVNLMQDVVNYFESVGYNITQQQQTDSSGNPLPVFQWYVTW